ncbi:MAG: HAD-IA family hydrolase [Pseudomonadota bacterium]
MAIEAILWDFGGVISTSPFDAFNTYEEEHGIPKDFIRSVNAKDPHTNAWAQFESSQISAAQFDEKFAHETERDGHRIPGRDVIPLLGGELRPRMVQVLKQCKASYAIACLTNNANAGEGPGMAGTQERATANAAVMSLFDLVIESSKEGMRKPDPRIYQLACERLAVAPENIVYLDDLGINLKPARQMGMTTIKVVHEPQAIAELSAALNLQFSFQD